MFPPQLSHLNCNHFNTIGVHKPTLSKTLTETPEPTSTHATNKYLITSTTTPPQPNGTSSYFHDAINSKTVAAGDLGKT